MFKFLLVAATVLGCAHAYSNLNDVHAEALKNELEISEHDGSYKYAYATSNGIAAQESGIGGYYADGSHSYHSPEGQLIQLQYTADENGYQPHGTHLPTPPPIPAAILKSLEYNRQHSYQEEEHHSVLSSHHQQQYRAPVKQYRAPVHQHRAPTTYRPVHGHQAHRVFASRRHFLEVY